MRHGDKSWLLALLPCVLLLQVAPASVAQVLRYEPSTPTASPYLNLFRDRGPNQVLPKYQSLVRPLQRQYRDNQLQQQILQQQTMHRERPTRCCAPPRDR